MKEDDVFGDGDENIIDDIDRWSTDRLIRPRPRRRRRRSREEYVIITFSISQ